MSNRERKSSSSSSRFFFTIRENTEWKIYERPKGRAQLVHQLQEHGLGFTH